MADIVDAKTRSRMMASVKRRGTLPELAVQHALRRVGYRLLLNRKALPGSPDVVIPDLRAVVFVHGCFWHRHGCERTTTPSSNSLYWKRKFEENLRRDRRNRRQLRRMGWRTFTVWECRRARDVERVIRALAELGRSAGATGLEARSRRDESGGAHDELPSGGEGGSPSWQRSRPRRDAHAER